MGFGLIPHSSVGYKLESLDDADLIKKLTGIKNIKSFITWICLPVF